MSLLLSTLTEKLLGHNDDEALSIALNHFNESNQPYNDLLEYLSTATQSSHINTNVINCLIQSFIQWKKQLNDNNNNKIPNFDKNLMSILFSKYLPIPFLKEFCDLFQISKPYQINLLTELLHDPNNSSLYKRALNIIVKFQYQFDFPPQEILLPLILNTKDHFIHIYLDKRHDLEEYLLDILNYLYQNGGRKIREILASEFNIRNQNINKKALGKLAVRYWNSFGNEQNTKYPNLASLQHKRTLGYLINVKYSATNEEKTMSDEAWNELVEEIVKGNDEVIDFLIECLVDRDDMIGVNYWMNQLKRPIHKLPYWVQKNINAKQNYGSTTITRDQNSPQKPSIGYYNISSKDVPIIFTDSMNEYKRLMDRLFKVNNEDEELFIGFDCEWKPIFNNTSSSKERISIMQIAFSNEIFLIDVLDFFHKCDTEKIQQRLADRLFDDDHVTILCYGFKADTSMLIASYPVFERVLASGRTLLDLSLVQTDLLSTQREIFPYITNAMTPSKDKGLSELVRLCFGKPLNKLEQCSNWERRPLRQAQVLYAAIDAYCLIDIYNFLRDRLQPYDYLQSFRGKKTLQLQTTNDNSSES